MSQFYVEVTNYKGFMCGAAFWAHTMTVEGDVMLACELNCTVNACYLGPLCHHLPHRLNNNVLYAGVLHIIICQTELWINSKTLHQRSQVKYVGLISFVFSPLIHPSILFFVVITCSTRQHETGPCTGIVACEPWVQVCDNQIPSALFAFRVEREPCQGDGLRQ